MMRAGWWMATMAILILVAGCDSSTSTDPIEIPAGPEPPIWVHVSATSTDAIELKWTDWTTNEAAFEIWRSQGNANNFAVIDTVDQDIEIYADTSLIAEQTFYYMVTGYDILGRRGRTSTAVWGKAHDNTPPTIPANPSPPADSSGIEGAVTLAWESTDPGGDVHFDVYFGSGRGSLSPCAMDLTVTTAEPCMDLELTRFYYWRVVATDEYGATALSPIWAFGMRVETVDIEGGYFFRGDCGHFNPAHPEDFCSLENPAVTDSFNIDKYEVSNQRFAQFLQERIDGRYIDVTEGDVHLKGEDNYGNYRPLLARVYPDGDEHAGIEYNAAEGERGSFIPRRGRENHPVVEVTWYGAAYFAESQGRRLPSEKEWEKAARGTLSDLGDSTVTVGDSTFTLGFGRPYPWGQYADAHRFNYEGSGDPSDAVVGVGTTEVGFFDGMSHSGFATGSNATPEGVFDLAGNVSEWCQDEARDYGSTNPSGMMRVKGGGWRSAADWCQTYWRQSLQPGMSDNAIGFRTVGPYGQD